MSIINKIIDKFYLQEAISEADLALILPKDAQVVLLEFDDVISVEELSPTSHDLPTRHGFSIALQNTHKLKQHVTQQSHQEKESAKK